MEVAISDKNFMKWGHDLHGYWHKNTMKVLELDSFQF